MADESVVFGSTHQRHILLQSLSALVATAFWRITLAGAVRNAGCCELPTVFAHWHYERQKTCHCTPLGAASHPGTDDIVAELDLKYTKMEYVILMLHGVACWMFSDNNDNFKNFLMPLPTI